MRCRDETRVVDPDPSSLVDGDPDPCHISDTTGFNIVSEVIHIKPTVLVCILVKSSNFL